MFFPSYFCNIDYTISVPECSFQDNQNLSSSSPILPDQSTDPKKNAVSSTAKTASRESRKAAEPHSSISIVILMWVDLQPLIVLTLATKTKKLNLPYLHSIQYIKS